jgi:hypothetical protein
VNGPVFIPHYNVGDLALGFSLLAVVVIGYALWKILLGGKGNKL